MDFSGWPTRPTGVRRFLYRLPLPLYHAGLGALLGRRLVLVHHVGRRTGLPREAVVEVVEVRDGPRGTEAITVGSGFGPRTDWYRNLRAHPETTVQLGGAQLAVTAVLLAPEQAADAMAAYARRHRHAARALCRFMGFRVDGSDADYRDVGRHLPMVRFDVHR